MAAELSELVVAFDGDDTLWHSEQLFADAQQRLRELLEPFGRDVDIDDKLLEVERRNLSTFGYGVKGFIVAMIETAIEISDGAIPGRDVHQIVLLGKELLQHPTELLDGVAESLATVAARHQMLLITKGDLLHQESKIAASGLADMFWQIEIVSEKDRGTYQRILHRHSLTADRFVMVGNSLASDVLPVLAIGGRAVHVPYHITWELEMAAADGNDFPTISSLRDLPPLLRCWS